MLGLHDAKPSKNASNTREAKPRLVVPKNADLAQSLLEIILDKSRMERFSNGGGGVAVMLLERWQIDILFDFGIIIQEAAKPPLRVQQSMRSTEKFRQEYISVLDNTPMPLEETIDHSPIVSPKELQSDVLADWFKLNLVKGFLERPVPSTCCR